MMVMVMVVGWGMMGLMSDERRETTERWMRMSTVHNASDMKKRGW